MGRRYRLIFRNIFYPTEDIAQILLRIEFKIVHIISKY